MTKLATWILVPALAAALYGCDNKDDSKASAEAKSSASTTTTASANSAAASGSAANKPAAAKPADANPTAAKPPAEKKAFTAEAPKRIPETIAKSVVPEDWTRMVDPSKGYGFWLPANAGTAGDSDSGADFFIAQVPEPHGITVIAIAFRDRAMDKDKLLAGAVEVITELGETDVKVESTTPLSPDYDLSILTSMAEGEPSKMKVLVAMDVTDNYILIVHSAASNFASNEETMDIIWGSFEMFSGGGQGRPTISVTNRPKPSGGGGCNSDADCSGGQTCVVYRCPGCNRCEGGSGAGGRTLGVGEVCFGTDTPCGAGLICNDATNLCERPVAAGQGVPEGGSCAEGEQCAAGLKCRTDLNICYRP